jgi:hypothetical protein
LDLGKYPRYGVVTLSGFVLFFLGFFVFLPLPSYSIFAISSLIAIVLLTVALSYGNGTPLGGFLLGLFTSVSFLLGFFLRTCVCHMVEYGRSSDVYLLPKVLVPYVPRLSSAVLAIASLGLFFGLLGYVFGHTPLRLSVTEPRIFRDYWSSIHRLGKSDRREYDNMDRKLGVWSFKHARSRWLRRLLERITEPSPDLVFVRSQREKRADEYRRGEIFNLSTGRKVGENFIDPVELTSRYRPLILKVSETSPHPKGIRRLAFERLIAKFLEWFIPSRSVWLFFLVLSAVLISSVLVVWRSNLAIPILRSSPYAYYDGVDYQVSAAAVTASIGMFFFVWRWRKASKELFDQYPDERILIFFVYGILALLYGFFFVVIVNPPGVLIEEPFIPETWIASWSWWSGSFLLLSFLLGFGYILIHRESEVVNTYFYDNTGSNRNSKGISPFRKPHDEPLWLRDDGVNAYWVLRFMYFWRYELTLIPHPDWERVEVWIDAETGTVKWIVSDYHYRELWYKVRGKLDVLYVSFFTNFHTPVPVIHSAEAQNISNIFRKKTQTLIKILFTGEAPEITEHLPMSSNAFPSRWAEIHPADWVQSFGLLSAAAAFCSKLPWTCWRYALGLEAAEKYRDEPATRLEDQPPRLSSLR